MSYRPVVLIIIDGMGIAPKSKSNAVSLAKTPNLDGLASKHFSATLQASGKAVGLPPGIPGNAEVGHLTLGAGKVVDQGSYKIDRAIEDGSFQKNASILGAMGSVKKGNKKLHLLGSVGSKGLRSLEGHLYALLKLAKQEKVKNIFIHLIVEDDVLGRIEDIQKNIEKYGDGDIATVGGRAYGSNFEKDWDKTLAFYEAMVSGEGASFPSAKSIKDTRKGMSDDHLEPIVIEENGGSSSRVEDGDSIIFFNFEPRSAVQLTKMFVLPSLPGGVKRRKNLKGLNFVTMTEFDKDLPVAVAFPPDQVDYPVARVISEAGLKQMHIAEMERYSHVAVFFDGGTEVDLLGEEKVLVPSVEILDYDKINPQMSADEIASRTVKEINTNRYDFVLVNFVNPGFVSEGGNMKLTKSAIHSADACAGDVARAAIEIGGVAIITSDYGKAENLGRKKYSEGGENTNNPVPLIIAAKDIKKGGPGLDPKGKPAGSIADVAPTILSLMNLKKPKEMTGKEIKIKSSV